MKNFSKIFFAGLAAILPIMLTFYILSWLGAKAESVLGGVIELILPVRWYVPGMGLVAGIALIFLVGLLLRAWGGAVGIRGGRASAQSHSPG